MKTTKSLTPVDEKSMIEILDVLDWVLEQQLQGKRPNDNDVAKQFNISLEEAIKIHDEIDISERE